MANTEIRLIIFFVAKDGEVLYSQQKQDLELTVAQIMNSLLPNLDLKLTPPKDVFFIVEDWNAKVGSQEIPGVTGKFGLGVQNEAGQSITEFCQENTLVITLSSNNTRDNSIHGHHQMVHTKTGLIIFFSAKYGETLFS